MQTVCKYVRRNYIHTRSYYGRNHSRSALKFKYSTMARMNRYGYTSYNLQKRENITNTNPNRQSPLPIYEYESRLRHENEEDAKVIFELIFEGISKKIGGETNMAFPKDIMWLCGAPGSGKGAMLTWIQYQRGYHAEPIKISSILSGSEIEALKMGGKLVSDRIVLTILLEKLLLPEYRTGVVVDGFPRTTLQAECIKLLFDKMTALRRKYDGTEHFVKFRRPKFHITVLYVDQEISIQRQLHRGQKEKEHNERVTKTGIGELLQIRETDVDPEKAKQRYIYFQDHIYHSIQSIHTKFPFHFISAEGHVDMVKASILKELQYQSSSELGDETFDMVRQVSLASEIKLHARHKLVSRLGTINTSILKSTVINVSASENVPKCLTETLFIWLLFFGYNIRLICDG